LREPFDTFIAHYAEPDTLFITCGLPCTAKTGLGETILRLKGYPLLRTDVVRVDLLKGEDIFDERVASDMNRRTRVYDEVFKQAAESLDSGGAVVIDATFITQALRERAAEIAAGRGKKLVIMETTCSQDVALSRIRRRSRQDYESNAITEQAYFNNERQFEPVDIKELKRLHPQLTVAYLRVDTTYDSPDRWYVVAMEEI